ncbi:hypothetical protein F511_10886 [Dorcoceras hygrometricum]|uniref:Retrotransposon gag domain-containing protein n=1 Tax=Dorcoceras hygrometricum TaxID=472368 RepID=A0A2Z7CT71_9LAMI|nr:hypothetical protein F511_10886 [Dorcoceras hygrometricum]
MGLTDADKVRCAIFMLKADVALWWKGTVVGLHLESLTWGEFKKVFFEKYFTVDARSQLIREFMSLRQGDRSVAEYVQQFERGCPFVPAIANVESEKLRQFTDGMRPDIRHDVNMADVETYMAAPVKGQSSHPPAKKPFQGPSKGPTQQGLQ